MENSWLPDGEERERHAQMGIWLAPGACAVSERNLVLLVTTP